MIEKIYIPTFGRTERQDTYDYLPEKWQKRSVLVVAESERETFERKGYPVLVCPCQGPTPEGEDPLDYGLSPTRAWIAHHAGKIKYAVLDDDILDFVYTPRPSEKDDHELRNPQINNHLLKPGYEHCFEDMMTQMDQYLDEVCIAALEVTWNPPREEDYAECWRQTVNHFYNGATLPLNDIDFTSLKCAQDYYVLLQLLAMGYKNRVNFRYRVRPAVTQAKGGCEVYRTIEVHNDSMEKLRDAFPDFVSLKVKNTKGGAWAGQDKYGATIQWKKAYKSSMDPSLVKGRGNSLEDFFT